MSMCKWINCRQLFESLLLWHISVLKFPVTIAIFFLPLTLSGFVCIQSLHNSLKSIVQRYSFQLKNVKRLLIWSFYDQLKICYCDSLFNSVLFSVTIAQSVEASHSMNNQHLGVSFITICRSWSVYVWKCINNSITSMLKMLWVLQ